MDAIGNGLHTPWGVWDRSDTLGTGCATLRGMSTMITGNGIPLFRLLTLRSGVKLEARGMRLTRGRTCTAIAKQEFGLSRGTRRPKVLEAIEAAITAAEAALEPGDIVTS